MKFFMNKYIRITVSMSLAFCCVAFLPQPVACKENIGTISKESQQHEWERLVETILPLRDEGKLKEAIAAGLRRHWSIWLLST